MSGKGSKTLVKRRVVRDERTGREQWFVSPEGVQSGATYMYVRQFTPDERYLFYVSELTGAPRLYRYEIASGELTQVSADEGELGWENFHVHPAGREVYYVAGGVYHAADVETLETRVVFDPVKRGYGPARQLLMFSRSGRWFSFSFKDKDGRECVGRCSSDGRDVQTLHSRPEGEGVQHLMFCNAPDEDLMSFSPAPDHQQEWDAPWEYRARTYLLNAATGAVEPFLVLPKPFTATHDFWSPNGDRLYFHKKTRPTWVPTWICSIERDTREVRTWYEHDEYKLGHSYATKDERWLVSDSQEPDNNPLVLIEAATGKGQVLCWPDSRVTPGHKGYSHVHPTFSPSNRYVLYTTDRGGIGQVVMVPVPEVRA